MVSERLTYNYNYYDDSGQYPLVVNSTADYYPFGCLSDEMQMEAEKMPGTETTGSQKYRYGYQGEFAESLSDLWRKDEETGWNQFELRMYDSRIGRWMTMDPANQFHSPYLAMGNNPITLVDADGAFAGPCKNPAADCFGIEKGDTFWDIERARGWEHGTLEKLNHGIDLTNLQIGQEIITPNDFANFSEALVNSELRGEMPAAVVVSLQTFSTNYSNMTYREIILANGRQADIFPNGPRPTDGRYVFDAVTGDAVIDMRHFLVIGKTRSRTLGDGAEAFQRRQDRIFGGDHGGNNANDPYSNELGFSFFNYLEDIAPTELRQGKFINTTVPNIDPLLGDPDFANKYIVPFLSSQSLREIHGN